MLSSKIGKSLLKCRRAASRKLPYKCHDEQTVPEMENHKNSHVPTHFHTFNHTHGHFCISASSKLNAINEILYRNYTTTNGNNDSTKETPSESTNKNNVSVQMNENNATMSHNNNSTMEAKRPASTNKLSSSDSSDNLISPNNPGKKSEAQLKREQILQQLRNQTFLTPESKIEVDRMKRKLDFEDKHVKAMDYNMNEGVINLQEGQELNSTQNTTQVSENEEDPYAYVQSLPPAKYVSTKDGAHYWESTFVYVDEEEDRSRVLQISLKDASYLREKYMVEDLNLALNMFMNGENAHPEGKFIPYNEERRMKNEFSDQVFEIVPQTSTEKLVAFFSSEDFRKNVTPSIWRYLLLIWVCITAIQATIAMIRRGTEKRNNARLKQEKKAIEYQQSRERARLRRIAEGKPIYDEIETKK